MLDSWSLQEDKHKSHEWGHLWNLVTIREGAEQATNLHISDLTCWLKGEMKLVYLLKIPISLQDLAWWQTYVDMTICTGKQSRKPWTPDFNQIKKTGCHILPTPGSEWTRAGTSCKVHEAWHQGSPWLLQTFQIVNISELLCNGTRH